MDKVNMSYFTEQGSLDREELVEKLNQLISDVFIYMGNEENWNENDYEGFEAVIKLPHGTYVEWTKKEETNNEK